MITIGEAARQTGIKVPTIRFYEQEGLLAPPERTDSGRRVYAEDDLNRLAFIKHARTLGFELHDVRQLLELSDHPEHPCTGADQIARRHLASVRERIAQLQKLETELSRISRSCAGGKKASACRVIEALAVRPPDAARMPKRQKRRRAK